MISVWSNVKNNFIVNSWRKVEESVYHNVSDNVRLNVWLNVYDNVYDNVRSNVLINVSHTNPTTSQIQKALELI